MQDNFVDIKHEQILQNSHKLHHSLFNKQENHKIP